MSISIVSEIKVQKCLNTKNGCSCMGDFNRWRSFDLAQPTLRQTRDMNLVLLRPHLVPAKEFSPQSGPQELLVTCLAPTELSGPPFGPKKWFKPVLNQF